jgi:post-segregation antitoxin (ccd killing protein)
MGKVELKIAIDAALVERAKAVGLELRAAAEAGIQAALAALAPAGVSEDQAKWIAENAKAIADHEERIAKYGLFGEEFRTW